MPTDHPQRPLLELVESFGYAHFTAVGNNDFGLTTVQIYITCDDRSLGIPAIRSDLLRKAGDMMAALEDGGYIVHDCYLTMRRVPIDCDLHVTFSPR